MPENIYSYLDGAATDPARQRKLNALPNGISEKSIIRFPSTLGDKEHSIPFTIFMPYKRNVGVIGVEGGSLGGFHSLNQLKNLPAPTFAIALPTPTSALRATYDATYNQFNVGQGLGATGPALERTIGAGRDTAISTASNIVSGDLVGAFGSAFGGAIETGTESVKALFNKELLSGQATIAGVAALSAALQELGSGEDTVNVFIGQANNPYTENAFRNMEFRQHVFNYTFMPKNPKDSEHIDRIVTLFKYGMLPKVGSSLGNAAFFDFPYEFQITHSIQDTTFTLLPSVLTTLEVDYGGGTDSPKLFRPGIYGEQYPAKITLSMTFKEMVLLTRDQVMHDGAYKDEPDVTGGAKRYRF